MKKIIFPLFLMLLLFAACTEQPSVKKDENNSNTAADSVQALKKFYFPVESLYDGLVYEYIDESTKNTVYYWLYKTVKDEAGDVYLIGTSYSPALEQQFFSREWVVANGTILKDYRFIQTDEATMKSVVRPAAIEENVVFPFSPVKDTSMAYRFRMKFSLLPDTTDQYDLTRDRKFGKEMEYDYDGKKLKAIQFDSKEYIEVANKEKGGHWNLNSDMTEIYAEGIGLVYTRKKSEGVNYTYILKRRFSMEEFLKMQGQE